MDQIPYGRQDINQADIDSVIDVLKSDFLTQGPAIEQFESALCAFTNSKHAVAVNSATSALHLACLALGVGAGDIVWTSAITFVASANCARFCGAEVDLVDINSVTLNMSIENLKAKLLKAERLGRLPKVVIPVHMAGKPCEMKEIFELSLRYKFKIIEDASHAIGANYGDSPIGSCKYSDITVFSFHPVKIITTGEGGAALTNDVNLAEKMRLLRSHGITRDPRQMKNPSSAWYYEQLELGFNYRITDIQAALGTSQINRLGEFVSTRRALASKYTNRLKSNNLVIPEVDFHESSWHLYIIRVDARIRERVFDTLRKRGILVNVHYLPVYRHPYYSTFMFDASSFPNAEKYYEEAISLPIFPSLSSELQDYIIQTLIEIVDEWSSSD